MRKSNPELVRVLSCVIALALILCGFALSAHALTPSGTTISTSSSAVYNNSSGTRMPVATSNTVTVTVGQVAGVAVTPATATATIAPGQTGYTAVSIKNQGNGSDSFSLSISGGTGWTPAIIKDANNDGIHQTTETTSVTTTGALAAGATSKCFLALTAPSTAASGTSVSVTLTATSVFDATKKGTIVCTATAGTPPASAYIREWLLNGYYANSDQTTLLSKDYLGGEAATAPSLGVSQGGKTWTDKTFTADYCDLRATYGSLSYVAAYGFTYVYAPSATAVQLRVGCNDGTKIWLNGSVVLTKNTFSGYTQDQYTVPVQLTAGWNRLLVKISQGTSNWGFSVKICDSSGNAVSGIKTSLSPGGSTTPGDTTAPVISNLSVGSVTTTAATVQWTTNEAATGTVKYGLSSTTLTGVAANTALLTQRSIQLTGLTAGTTYYFSVTSTDAAGNSASSSVSTFKTTSVSTTEAPCIRNWLLNGYYANSDQATRLSNNYLVEGEAYASPLAGVSQGGKVWTARPPDVDYINLSPIYGWSTSDAAAYACTYLYSPSAVTAELRAGSDDGIKMWLNGKTVWTNDVYRSYVADQDQVPVSLFAGWNRLLVKASQGTGYWGFSVKVCDSSGASIPGIYSAINTGDTVGPVISNVNVTNVTSSSMTVNWTTNEPCYSRVDYGTSAMTDKASHGVLKTSHSLKLTGLSSVTTYYFVITSGDVAGNYTYQAGFQQRTN